MSGKLASAPFPGLLPAAAGLRSSNFSVSFAPLCFLVAVICGSGCGGSELRRQAILNEIRAERFVSLIARGETTREEEQQFIAESRRAWAAFRSALGVERGKTTAGVAKTSEARKPSRKGDEAWRSRRS